MLTVKQAAEYAQFHPMTIANALRSGELHGFQRAKNATWRMQPACVDAWMSGTPCEHRATKKRAA